MNNELVFNDLWQPLARSQKPLISTVTVSNLALEAVKDFDYSTDGKTAFLPYEVPSLPAHFGIGLIVGASGTGKSTLLKEFGEVLEHHWEDKAIIDHFDTAEQAQKKLFAVGLTSIPTWFKPYSVLSNGEKFRANLGRALQSNAVIDEYTSVVDRNIALAASKSLRQYVTNENISNLVIATCHRDVIPYLQPDWIIDTDAGLFVINPRECLRRKSLVAQVFEVTNQMWRVYAQHHYLKADLSPFARCFVAVVNEQPAAFYAIISYPSGTVRNAFRGHRLVTHPDYQGFGIGARLSDFVAAAYVEQGKRFFAKTAHPRLGEYRERSNEWKPTSKNKRFRTDVASDADKQARRERFVSWTINPNRFTYSHEFIKTKA